MENLSEEKKKEELMGLRKRTGTKAGIVKTTGKGPGGKSISRKHGETFYLMGHELNASSSLTQFISDKDVSAGFIDHIICGVLTILIMVQLRLSQGAVDSKVIDQLESFRFYKKRFLSNMPGRALCVMVALLETILFQPDDLTDVVIAYTDSEITPCKPVASPNKSNFGDYIAYRLTQVLGTLQSCPATNIKVFGLSATVIDWDLDTALKSVIPPSFSYDIEIIKRCMRDYFLTNKGGLQSELITFTEIGVSSKIENEIFSGLFQRQVPGGTSLGEGGKLPENALTEEDLKSYLTPRENIAYAVALNQGNKTLLRKLNSKASKAKLLESNKSTSTELSPTAEKTEADKGAAPSDG